MAFALGRGKSGAYERGLPISPRGGKARRMTAPSKREDARELLLAVDEVRFADRRRVDERVGGEVADQTTLSDFAAGTPPFW